MFHDPATGVRVLTIEEANALVPRLEALVGAQLELADEIQKLVAELHAHAAVKQAEGEEARAELIDVTVYPSDSVTVTELKRKLARKARSYKQGWGEVADLGAVVKDTTIGLLDFYGKVDDRLVWLCWKYGETSIDHYHELDAGFAGRKPLAEVRKRMLN